METHTFESKLSQGSQLFEPAVLREISVRICKVNGINMGQGTCQLPVPPELLDAAERALRNGLNRYTLPRGLESLRHAVANKLKRDNGIIADPEREIIISSGSTGAFEGVCAALIDAGDEVVIFEPFYPYHYNTLQRYGAKIRYVSLHSPEWKFDADELERAFSDKTKFVVINTPSNPTGKVFTREELESIGNLCEKHDCLTVTDEIYEYLVYDGREHISPGSLPVFKDRTITIGGYSKTFAITGWRIGFMVLPVEIADAVAPLVDNIYVCAPAPLQQAVAEGIEHFDANFYRDLCEQYRQKRDMFCGALEKAGLKALLPQGAYYAMADISEAYPGMSSWEFTNMMIEKAHVAGIPSNDFVRNPDGQTWVRFCFSVPDELLETATKQLALLSQERG